MSTHPLEIVLSFDALQILFYYHDFMDNGHYEEVVGTLVCCRIDGGGRGRGGRDFRAVCSVAAAAGVASCES